VTRILVTGASGFVGRHLCELLTGRGYVVRAALRSPAAHCGFSAERAIVGDIGADTEWSVALEGVEAVVHCAARAHAIGDLRGLEPLYLESNAHGTQRLARAAATAGVRRFVYLSSVKVNGDPANSAPLTSFDVPHPTDAYGRSKYLGETHLQRIAAATTMQSAIVRSPLVYGPGVRANFLRLLRSVARGVPLPLGRVENSRSLVSVWNLCDLLERLLREPLPAHGVFMVSDAENLSTVDLVRRIGLAMGRPARLLPVPVGMLRAAGILTGRRAEVARLCGSLTVDSSLTRSELAWYPPMSVDEALARTVAWYLAVSDHA
jgi:UDP-glucose 4-epimerase